MSGTPSPPTTQGSFQGLFPAVADSVAQWLDAIKLGRYNDQFASVSVEELSALTNDRLTELGIAIPGHRARLLQAARQLGAEGPAPMDADKTPSHEEDGESELAGGSVLGSPAAPLPTITMPQRPSRSVDLSGSLAARAAQHWRNPATKEKQKYNSTSTMFIRHTIFKPEIQEVIYCVAIVLHDRMRIEAESGEGEHAYVEQQVCFPFFSEDNNPLYKEPNADEIRRSRQKRERVIPSESFIFDTIKSVYDCAQFSEECIVMALIYIERLLNTTGVKVLTSTWRPIVLAALIVAQKVFDDRSLQNYDFAVYCPMFTLQEINHLENKFLELLQYNVSINASTYASFYFHIQTLCHSSAEPRTQLDLESARLIEAKVSERQRVMHAQRKTRSESEPFRMGRTRAAIN